MNTEELNQQIGKAAYLVAVNWPGVMEADDIQQEIWVKVMESQRYQDQMEKSDPALRMEFLKRLGMQIVGREVSSYELFSGNSYYGTDHVRKILEKGLLTVSRDDLGDMNETLTDFLDLHESFDALKKMNEDQAQAIWVDFVDGSYDKSTSAKREKLRRAVVHITDLMNQAHRRRFAEYEDGPGTRKAISNAKAQAISSQQWEGKK